MKAFTFFVESLKTGNEKSKESSRQLKLKLTLDLAFDNSGGRGNKYPYFFPMILCCFVAVRLSQETMELCAIIQFVVELQRLLWLYSPILDRQALLQLLQVKAAHGSEGRESTLCRLRFLLSSHCCCLNSSLLWTHGFTVLLQSLCSSATPSQPAGSMFPALNQKLARVLFTPSWCY